MYITTLKFELNELLKDKFTFDYITYNGSYYLVVVAQKMIVEQSEIKHLINKISAMGFCYLKTEWLNGFKNMLFKEMIE